jgi:hypothetical protein
MLGIDFRQSRRKVCLVMKKFLLGLACVGLISVPAFAGSCPSGGGGCGDKSKEGEKGKDATKQTLTLRVQE